MVAVYAQVNEHAVRMVGAKSGEVVLRVEEISVYGSKFISKTGEPPAGFTDGFQITVDANEAGAFGEAFQYHFCVTATTQCAVHKYAAAFRLEVLQYFLI